MIDPISALKITKLESLKLIKIDDAGYTMMSLHGRRQTAVQGLLGPGWMPQGLAPKE